MQTQYTKYLIEFYKRTIFTYTSTQGDHFLDLTGIFYKKSSISFSVQHYHTVFPNKKSGFEKPGKVASVTTLLLSKPS